MEEENDKSQDFFKNDLEYLSRKPEELAAGPSRSSEWPTLPATQKKPWSQPTLSCWAKKKNLLVW